MESYLMMLYVTLEQESALKSFFIEHGWPFCKPDLSVITDKVGPAATTLSTVNESNIITDSMAVEGSPVVTESPLKSGSSILQNYTSSTPSQSEPLVPKLKINFPAPKEPKENKTPIRIGKRKSTSKYKKPVKSVRQSKDIQSVEEGSAETQIHLDTASEQMKPGKIVKPVMVQMENGQTIEIKVEQDCEAEESADSFNDSSAVDDFNEAEASDQDDVGENEIDQEKSGEAATATESDISQVELPDNGSAPKRERKKRIFQPYNRELLLVAYNDVTENGIPVRAAARKYGVPKSTLEDRVSKRVPLEVKTQGPNPVLNEEEESKLTEHLNELADIGYGFTADEITLKATDYAVELEKREITQPFSNRWYRGYVKRNPPPHVRKLIFTLAMKQRLCTSKSSITNYFNKLNELVTEFHVVEMQNNIYVLDDIEFVVPTEDKFQTVTIIGAGNAAGQKVPPYFVVASGLAENDHQAMRKSQMVIQGMKVYLQNHFLKYANKSTHVEFIIMFYDAHKLPLALKLIEWAKSINIVLFPMPPQSTHIMNEESVFQAVKAKYDSDYGDVAPYKHLTSTSGVVSLLKPLYNSVVTSEALEEAFSKYGLYPLQTGEVMCDFLKKQGMLFE